MKNTRKTIMAALFAALCCVSTIAIVIPSPMDGYVNLGDCFVLLSGWFLGPLYGGLAAGIGSFLSDVFTGYLHYAPATLIIKGLMGILAASLYRLFHRLLHLHKKNIYAVFLSAFLSECFMVFGYFLYAALLLGNGLAATASIPGNLMQGTIGIIASLLLFSAIKNIFPSDFTK